MHLRGISIVNTHVSHARNKGDEERSRQGRFQDRCWRWRWFGWPGAARRTFLLPPGDRSPDGPPVKDVRAEPWAGWNHVRPREQSRIGRWR